MNVQIIIITSFLSDIRIFLEMIIKKSPLAQMRIMRSLRIGDGRSKIYLQKDFEQEILNLEVLEILKKQEILHLVNKHAFFQL